MSSSSGESKPQSALAFSTRALTPVQNPVAICSDANLERYGIRPADLSRALTADPKVHAHAIFLSSMGGAAERLKQALPPGRSSVCLDAADLPAAFKHAFASAVLREE